MEINNHSTRYDIKYYRGTKFLKKIIRRSTMNNNCLCGLFNNNECLIWVIIAILVVLALTCNNSGGCGCGSTYSGGCGCGC